MCLCKVDALFTCHVREEGSGSYILRYLYCLTFFRQFSFVSLLLEESMDKISLRQVISVLNKGGSLPDWISLQEIQECIRALKRGARNYTGTDFVSYAIIEDGVLCNILYVKSSRDATILLRLLAGDE